MLLNVLRILMIIWISWTLIRWYNQWRERERKKAFNAGRRSKGNGSNRNPNTDDIGDYVDFEEVKE